MITNERQYRIAKAELGRFKQALAQHDAHAPDPHVHERIRAAMRDAIVSEMDELSRQLEHYDALREGRIRELELDRVADLPIALIEGRIAAWLTQRDLAERLGVAEQQVQRWEQNTYGGVSLDRLHQVAEALDLSISETVQYARPIPRVPTPELRRRAARAGVPDDLVDRISSVVKDHELTRVLAKAFNWSPSQLAHGVPPQRPASIPIAFQAGRMQKPDESALLHLAINVSRLAAATRSPTKSPPLLPDPAAIRQAATNENGRLTFESLLSWSWEAGIIVIPLLGAGAFAAATWVIDGTPVIVLKDGRDPYPFWMFDLAHEIGHLALGHVQQHGIVDRSLLAPPRKPTSDEGEQAALTLDMLGVDTALEASPAEALSDTHEDAADTFALDLLVPDRERIFEQIRRETGLRGPAFKPCVERLAVEAKISPALLGLVAAHELEDVGRPLDRWGSATNLAKQERPARPVVEHLFASRTPITDLPPLDAALVRAVTLTDSA